jgi:hypothetical protein
MTLLVFAVVSVLVLFFSTMPGRVIAAVAPAGICP